jgi:hypothetical protein
VDAVRLRRTVILLFLAVAVLFLVPTAASFYTDWLWFRELGYEQVILRSWNAQATVFVGTFAVAAIFLALNFRIGERAMTKPRFVLGATVDGRPVTFESRRISGLSRIVAVLVAFVMAAAGAANWLTWLNYLNAVPFGSADPLFHRDAAFYVFQLPLYDIVRQQAMVLSVLALAGSALFYVLSGSFVLEQRFGVALWPSLRLVPSARRHLALLAALIFGLMAWGVWLDIPRTLVTPATIVFGAAYVDWHANIPFLYITLAVLLASVLLALLHGFGRRGWPIPSAIALYLLVSITGSVYSGFVQRFSVLPNEQDKEREFIQYNIAATRQAYALDRVDERELSGDAELQPSDIAANAATIENVRLWDHQPLLQTFSQIQEIRTYYDFKSVDNDRYLINGKKRQVMLSARELNTENLPNPSFVNERLSFTHGYGLTLGPVNQVTTEGLPVLFIKDLPPVSSPEASNLPVRQPGIYYGEMSSNYVLVKTQEPEFDYPRGAANVTTFYQGSGGVPVGGFWRRMLFALRFGSTDILVTRQINAESRILYHRRIAERVATIAPFLQFDADPYPVVSDGRIFWIQDAYTTTGNYPYSTPVGTPTGEINYIRTSVKIVVDAYNGTTTFYLAEPGDPIALTLARIFPGLLKPLDQMPEDLRQHVRYPEQIFRIQASVFTTYHMTNPLVFYNKEDQWQVPVIEGDRNAVAMEPYYAIMKLPGESKTEFIQILPFTPHLKDNLSAWMVARSDGANYGHLLVFQFPKQKIVYGPKQIVARINQDQLISPAVTLWDQQGSKVIWGTLLVIPIEESLIYVRPLYLQAANGKIPELKRVIVAYQNRIVMTDTLTQGLIQIFGPSIAASLPQDRLESSVRSLMPPAPGAEALAPPPGTVTAEPVMAALVAEANDHFNRALKAQRDGDWALYGEELKKLGDVLKKMETIRR